MKSASLYLLLATAASSSAAALLPPLPVLDDYVSTGQAPLREKLHNSVQDRVQSVLEDWGEYIRPVKDDVKSTLDDAAGDFAAGVERATNAFYELQDKVHHQLQESGHGFPDKTIYDLLQLSNHTKKFLKALDDHPDVVKLLNGTDANHTLFVPIDEAFEHLPDHDPPSKEFIEAALKYHIGLGDYPAHRLLTTHTLPTAYNEKLLGGEPQRLRTSVGLTGLTVNFYSKVIATDITAKNGVVHAVRSILVPPPAIGRILTLDPSRFSTLLLAYEKTDFVKYVHGINMVGSTVFVPDNSAFAALGPRANAFLFNTETGLKCLNALLKYHIAPNATLYSDAFYDKTGKKGGDKHVEAGREHYDLTTLLDGANVGVDIAQVLGFKIYRVNGFAHAKIQDGIGKNGVIQVVDKVLIPPRKRGGNDAAAWVNTEIDVEDLIERLADYM